MVKRMDRFISEWVTLGSLARKKLHLKSLALRWAKAQRKCGVQQWERGVTAVRVVDIQQLFVLEK
jgi:hypothetical protein